MAKKIITENEIKAYRKKLEEYVKNNNVKCNTDAVKDAAIIVCIKKKRPVSDVAWAISQHVL